MSSEIRLKVGNTEAVVSLNGPQGQFTDQQVGKALERYAKSVDLTLEGTLQNKLQTVLGYMVTDMRRRSRAVQRAELEAANRSAIDATVDTDNAF